MKKYFAFIIIFTLAILSCFNIKNLSSIINKNKIDIDNFSIKSDNEIMYFSRDKLEEILKELSIEIHSKKEVSDRTIIEGYTSKISDYIVVNNFKTNIQISYNDVGVIVGTPLIDESF